MVTDATKCTLLVRHLPAELDTAEQKELLKHFGAVQVHCMGTRGPMRHTAFATFADVRSSGLALQRLHQLEVLGSTLVVEYSRQSLAHHHPSLLTDKTSPPVASEGTLKKQQKPPSASDGSIITDKLNQLNAELCFTYPMNPMLEYAYPAPSVSILANISNALASVPRFYVQVLHLMNKLHLPAPFGAVTPLPPIPLGTAPMQPSAPGILQEEDMDVSSSEESELASSGEEEERDVSSTEVIKTRKRRRHRLQKIVSLGPDSQAPMQQRPEDMFDQTTSASTAPKQIKLILPTAITDDVTQPTTADDYDPFATDTEHETAEGFGKLKPSVNPQNAESDNSDTEPSWGDGTFISSKELRRGQISQSHRNRLTLFRNYNSGDPTSRLYIKNLSKTVEEKDLHYVFGRYVDWRDDNQKQMFDIRLMKEGRMKGQAFVTMPSTRAAEKACRDTNAFLLHDRAMIVQFARSAKPKQSDSKTSAKKP